MEYLFGLIFFALGGYLAFVMYKNKRKHEDQRMKNIIKQAIDESKKTD